MGVFLAIVALFGPEVVAAVPSAGCQRSALDTGRRIEREIAVGDQRREFILDVPTNVAPGTPVPLLFDFHGFGHSGAGVWKVSDFKVLAEQHGFITVYPTGLPVTLKLRGQVQTRPGWQMHSGADNRDLAFTRAMLDAIERDYCVDLNRVFTTGFSNGAFFSTLLGCEMSERFAAVAPVGGGALRADCRPRRPLPVLIQHGTRDELIPIEWARAGRDQWLSANGCEPSSSTATDGAPACVRHDQCTGKAVVVYCEEEYSHHWPAQAADRIWRFFSER